jgi:hypothetical protein
MNDSVFGEQFQASSNAKQDIFRNSIIVKHFSKNFEISTQKIATLSTRSNASPVATELLGEQNKIAATRSNSMK